MLFSVFFFCFVLFLHSICIAPPQNWPDATIRGVRFLYLKDYNSLVVILSSLSSQSRMGWSIEGVQCAHQGTNFVIVDFTGKKQTFVSSVYGRTLQLLLKVN